ncbi:hypothetical protein XU18_0042 [Perkinsela sp. CCAP 1560/4]|nr:hypothetical protein XU18_0042 [Perkinsela sp. CCAP 1560/4]|eukprot:KNH09357.1 hypothetical protein XU18_0042 [Perkinsela sp. CCAP 1560/4]
MANSKMSECVANFFAMRHALAVLRYAGVIGAAATICYSLYMLILHFEFFLAFMYVYLILFAFALIFAEVGVFNQSRYRAYFLFLTRHAGRGLFYIFVAGLLLTGWGIPIAAYLIIVGVLNVCVSFRQTDPTPIIESIEI